MKTKKEMKVLDIKGTMNNYATFYLSDGNNTYAWYTASDKAYEELKWDETYNFSFIITDEEFIHDEYGNVTMIKNVRF